VLLAFRTTLQYYHSIPTLHARAHDVSMYPGLALHSPAAAQSGQRGSSFLQSGFARTAAMPCARGAHRYREKASWLICNCFQNRSTEQRRPRKELNLLPSAYVYCEDHLRRTHVARLNARGHHIGGILRTFAQRSPLSTPLVLINAT